MKKTALPLSRHCEVASPLKQSIQIILDRRVVSTLLAMTFFFSVISPVLAQTATSLTIAPARQQHELKPGESTNIILKLMNTGDSSIVGTLFTADFIVTGNDGKPQFLEDKLALPAKYAAASWFKLPYDRLAIPAHGKVETQIKITAPKNALPGGHYAAIIFEPAAAAPLSGIVSDKAGQSAVAPRLAGLVYLVIPGKYEETALVTQFFAPKFSQTGPINIATAIKNTSPVHLRPSGTITITNMFGDVTTVLPLEEVNIFPDASKLYQNTIPTKWLVGRYRADLSAGYGSQGRALSGTIFFTVFPMTLASYILILIAALIFLVNLTVKKNRKHQQELEAEVAELKKEVNDLEKK